MVPSNYLTCWSYKSIAVVGIEKKGLFVIIKVIAYFDFILEFRKGNAPILVATDVASRGLGMSHSVFYCKTCVNDLLLLKVRVAKSTLSYNTIKTALVTVY